MIGNNRVHFCKAEMNRAIEQYLKSIFQKEYGDRLKVISVDQDAKYGNEGFTIHLEGQTIPECPKDNPSPGKAGGE